MMTPLAGPHGSRREALHGHHSALARDSVPDPQGAGHGRHRPAGRRRLAGPGGAAARRQRQHLGAIAAAAPNDVWAVGNYLPDTAKSNQDATLSLAAHFDGTKWTSTPTANTGSNFDTLFGVAAVPGKAWAVGLDLDFDFNGAA